MSAWLNNKTSDEIDSVQETRSDFEYKVVWWLSLKFISVLIQFSERDRVLSWGNEICR